MTVTAVRKDPQTLTMTLEAEFDASPERVWQLWADPRQLERWWARRTTPPPSPSTSWHLAVASSTGRGIHQRRSFYILRLTVFGWAGRYRGRGRQGIVVVGGDCRADHRRPRSRAGAGRSMAPAVEVAIFRAEAALCVADCADGAGASASVLPPRGAVIRA